MLQKESTPLPIAVRVYPEPQAEKRNPAREKPWELPEIMLVFDTETLTDATQRLTFGSYRFIENGCCLEEGLFCADDLPDKDRMVLKQYVATHKAETADDGVPELLLLPLRLFRKKLYKAAYNGRCLLVGFNLPFDLSRIANTATKARGRFAGGFSLALWTYIDRNGNERSNQYRPRIGIKQIDSKRALKGFTARKSPDETDLIPEGSPDGKSKPGYIFRGHLLDLRTLAFALTDRGYSLESACKAFGVKHGKQATSCHGIVTTGYIDYNRRDVLATAELAAKLIAEYDRHPIDLQETKAYSPASIGKAYLRAMGIKPIRERQPDFPAKYLGYAQSAFFGGRTSAHIRKVPVPVVYTDFLSMYPTVNNLMGLWRFVTAREIRVVEHCREEIQDFLNRLTAKDLFNPETWKHLTAFVRLIPDGDILPSRAKYSTETNDWQVAVNHVHAEGDNQALWYSLPDVVASVLLTGRVPKIVDAFRIEPVEEVEGLKPVKLRGAVGVDPREEDFFKIVIEQRKSLASRADLSGEDRARLDKTLKVLANATSYGINAEMNRQEADAKVEVICHGIDEDPYTCRVSHPEVPGEYCFPPLASLITGAARLMLALLEHSVTQRGGTYAMEDTDSMAIVATEHGGPVACPGGSNLTKDASAAINALSWNTVQEIVDQFAALNPYGRSVVPGSILKIEDDNFDPRTGKQRQIFCVAISAKRYARFLWDQSDNPVLLRKGENNKVDGWSEHGLGYLLNPTDPDSDDREWTAQAWLNTIRKSAGLSTQSLPFENLPAVGRLSASSPAVMKALGDFNHGKHYRDQIKPFNFLLTCYINPLGHPVGTDPERFHLIAPYQSDSRRWLKVKWIDQYTGQQYRITTAGHHGSRQAARVKTYGEVLREYEFHPESKCADADGEPCRRQTVGLLQRRHIRVEMVRYIGKESNLLDDVQTGLVHASQNVYTEYVDPRRDEWQTVILPALNDMTVSMLIEKTGMSRRALQYLRKGGRRPQPKNLEKLEKAAREFTTSTSLQCGACDGLS